VLRVEAIGTSIVAKKNGSAIISVTDSSLTSGRLGITGYSADTSTYALSWTGGNTSGGGGPSIVVISGALMRMRMNN
jgi:hypothetical protein